MPSDRCSPQRLWAYALFACALALAPEREVVPLFVQMFGMGAKVDCKRPFSEQAAGITEAQYAKACPKAPAAGEQSEVASGLQQASA